MGSGASSQSGSESTSCTVCRGLGRAGKRLPFHALPWGIVASFDSAKWAQVADYHGFPKPMFCPVKARRLGELVWNSPHVLVGSHEREEMTLTYQRHYQAVSVVHPYKTNYFITDYIGGRQLSKVLPGNGNCVTFIFAPNIAHEEAETSFLIYALNEIDNIKAYFFLENPYPYDIEIHQVELSPNQGRVCVLMSEKDKLDTFSMHVFSKRPAAYELNFQGNMFALEYEVPGITACTVVPKLMFDPRYHTRRLGIINVRSIQFLEVHNYFSVYDLSKKAIRVSDQVCDEAIKSTQLVEATYSPDGAYLVALVICVPPGDAPPELASKHARAVIIFDTDSLCLLRTIHTGIQNMKDCFVRLMPTFSRCGRKFTFKRDLSVLVVQFPCPRTLQALCKSVILHRKDFDDSCKDLPLSITDFLQNKSYLH